MARLRRLKRRTAPWPAGNAAAPGSGWRGHPGRQLASQRCQRQRPVAQDLIVELAQVELRPVTGGDLASERLDLALTQLVGQGLARPADIAVGLDHGIRLGQSGDVTQEVDRALALPAEGVESGVDDQSSGAPGLAVEH